MYALTDSVHLLDDDQTDLLGYCDLRPLPQQPPHERAQDEVDTFARVHGVYVEGGRARIACERERVVEQLRDVALQPHAAHALAKLNVRLRKGQMEELKTIDRNYE